MTPTRLAIEEVDFHLRNVRTRLPFRYGKANLVAMPLLHIRLLAAGGNGRRVEGYSADCLPPKWFDKDPAKDYRANIEDLLNAAQIGATRYREAASSPRTVSSIWLEAHPKTIETCFAQRLNGLTASFASSLLERALIDAACKSAGMGIREWILQDGPGLDPCLVHPDLAGRPLKSVADNGATGRISIRHTVGLADPITESDIPNEDRLGDGLPQSLEAWVRDYGIRYLKIKASGDLDSDIKRLERISNLLDQWAGPDAWVSLDGNEVFKSASEFSSWQSGLLETSSVSTLLKRVLYIEQPLDRSIALSPQAASGLSMLPLKVPVIIDESDDALDSFRRAVDLGYRGTSVKNCKGPLKGMLNALLVQRFNKERGGGFLLTGEDLANLPVVPLQQDLAAMDILGLPHVERNGHHYFHGLDHLTSEEREECLRGHAALYEPFEGGGKLRIRNGSIDVASLRRDGFGSVGTPAFGKMAPLSDWSFETLGI
jgi:hypothetical protein